MTLMTIATLLPEDEDARLRALQDSGLLDTGPEQAYDDLTMLASQLCGTPVALVSLVDRDRQWFKSRVGFAAEQTPRELAFCAHAILQRDVMIVADARTDPRFADNPLVTGSPGIRFYAGAPLEVSSGHRIGTLCVIDTAPRQLTDTQRAALEALSRQVVAQIELRRKVVELERARRRQAAFERQLQDFNKELTSQVSERTQALLAQLDRANLYFDAVGSMMVIADREGRIVRANNAAGKVLGHAPDALVGEDWFALCFPPDEEAAGRRFFASLIGGEHGKERRFRGHVMTADGRRRIIGWHTTLLDDDTGLPGELLGVGEDMTDRLAAEEQLLQTLQQLEHSNIALQQFVHVASHDLREPINSILNFARLLAREGSSLDADRRARFVEFIVRGGERLRALVDDLLAYVRLDSAELHCAPVALGELVDDIRHALSDALLRSGAELRVGALPVTLGDRSLLGLVLQNLIGNALKFQPADGTPRVTVEAESLKQEIRVSVRDNGIGIAPEYQERIFQTFQRLHSRSEYEGTGLGLALCRRIAEMHGGRLQVESAVGMGSRFILTLPRHEGARDPSRHEEDAG